MSHDGRAIYRLAQNPMERKFHEAWKKRQLGRHTLEYLLGDGTSRGKVSEHDEMVAATVIQWLGSPVGQAFLRDVMQADEEST